MNRHADFIQGVIHPTNISDNFNYLLSFKKVRPSDEVNFKKFVHYIAEKNAGKNLTVEKINKYIKVNFDQLWALPDWKDTKDSKDKAPQANPQTQREKMTSDIQHEITPSTSRRRTNIGNRRNPGNMERYMPPNEDERAHNFLNENVSYEYTVAPPSNKIDYSEYQVPANYKNDNMFETQDNVSGGFNQQSNYARIKNASNTIGYDVQKKESTEIYGGIPLHQPGRALQAAQTAALLTDGSKAGVLDQNIALTRQLADDKISQEFVINLDSRLRNIGISKKSNSYKMNLFDQSSSGEFGWVRSIKNGLTNITNIEILDATIPNIIRDSTLQFYEPYIYIDIAEIKGNLFTPITEPQRVFSKLSYMNSDTIKDTPHLTLTPINCCKTYRPENPLNSLKTITLTFYNFDGEIFDFGDDAPAILSITNGNPTLIQTVNPHGILTGDRVYLRGIITGNTTFDADLNRPKGWIVAVNAVDTFEISYDSTGMPPVQAPGNALIAKLQNNITLRITSYTTDVSG